MDNVAHNARFREFYSNNEGKIYKSIELDIRGRRYNYDIRWGDPHIIFDPHLRREQFPLAITIIPHRTRYPEPRIFLHEMLDEKHGAVFEMIVAHEVGHLWLHDVVGVNNPCTTHTMNEKQSECWADFFAYCFFRTYRNNAGLEDFASLLKAATQLQIRFYDIDATRANDPMFDHRAKELIRFGGQLRTLLSKGEPRSVQMYKAIEETLTALGDMFAP